MVSLRNKQKLAAKMRRHPTKAEACLHKLLKIKRVASKFKRQAIVRGYIADFYNPTLGLVIEVDGFSHLNREEYDKTRDNAMEGAGLTVLRFTNEEVLHKLPSVWVKIEAALADGG